MSKILLLDVMATLVTEPFIEIIPKFLNTSLEELLSRKHPSSWIEFEHGQCDEASYLARFFKDETEIDGEGLKQVLEDAYEWIDGMEPLLAELKVRGVPMHALSNYPIWYQVIEKKLGLSRYLEWSFVSCETGVRKPDPEAFLGPARTLGVEPGQCLFVDDRRKNTSAAEAVGMPAVLFRGAENLREALDEHGVLPR